MPTISVKNLSKTYDFHEKEAGFVGSVKSIFKRKKQKRHAVKSISFSIEQGEIVGFVGPNGAGKTTALKMLSGILHPTSGEAKVLGFTPHERKREFQKQFSLVMGQKNQLWWDLPAMDSFLLNKEIYEVPDKDFNDIVERLSELLDVKDVLNVQVRKLSLGQRMKCELIAALLHRPKVLFLDEPTIGLDVISQQGIRDFLKTFNKEYQTTIILTSHYMDDIEELCERVMIIDHGELQYDGGLKDLTEQHIKNKYLHVTFKEKVDRATLEAYGEIIACHPRKVVLRVPKEKIRVEAANILSSDLPIDDILIEEPDIEHILRNLFTRS